MGGIAVVSCDDAVIVFLFVAFTPFSIVERLRKFLSVINPDLIVDDGNESGERIQQPNEMEEVARR